MLYNIDIVPLDGPSFRLIGGHFRRSPENEQLSLIGSPGDSGMSDHHAARMFLEGPAPEL
jgi:hypothetical protein